MTGPVGMFKLKYWPQPPQGLLLPAVPVQVSILTVQTHFTITAFVFPS